MISVADQFYLDISLPDFKKPFLSEENLNEFIMIEYSGNQLPEMQLRFVTRDVDVLNYLNEGNTIDVVLGRNKHDEEGLIRTSFTVLNQSLSVGGADGIAVSITGVLDVLSYASLPRMLITDEMSAIEAMKLATNGVLLWDKDNPSTSSDKQYWIQNNISNMAFVNKLWMRAHTPNSFYSMAIPADKLIRIRDMKTYLGNDEAWNISPNSVEGIKCSSLYVASNDTGLQNVWAGYNREKLLHDIENGTDITIAETAGSMLSLSKALTRNKEANKKISEIGTQNENIHEHYWNAHNRNLQGNVLLSTASLNVTYPYTFDKIKPLDLVMFTDNNPMRQESSFDAISGKYVTGAVSRRVSGRSISTSLMLYREAFSGSKGDLE